ncbi:hypothetical protein TNCV_2523301 [Trichonephila clavipes]|nr:hypothetical protein TNCV_2523301 [Trichonephila clavipes]
MLANSHLTTKERFWVDFNVQLTLFRKRCLYAMRDVPVLSNCGGASQRFELGGKSDGVNVQMFWSSGQFYVKPRVFSYQASLVLLYRPTEWLSRPCPARDLNPGLEVEA